MLLFPLGFLLGLAFALDGCAQEQFTKVKFDEIKTDPFQKIVVMGQKDKVDDVCDLLNVYSMILSKGLGIVTYILDPEQESEENLKTLFYEPQKVSVFVQSDDGMSVRFGGELDIAKEDPIAIRDNLQEFIEIRLAMPGKNLTLDWPVDGLEGVVDGGKNEYPALIGLAASPRHTNFIQRMATRNKGSLRVYNIDCMQAEDLRNDQKALCAYGPALLFVHHFEKYEGEIRLYKTELDSQLDELGLSRWVDQHMNLKDSGEYITLEPEEHIKDVNRCIPSCGESKNPLHVAPKLLKSMLEVFSRRLDLL